MTVTSLARSAGLSLAVPALVSVPAGTVEARDADVAPGIAVVSVDNAGRPANGPSVSPAMSANGRYVVFLSEADNLVPGDSNERRDVFVRDRWRDRTERVSVASDGQQPNANSDFVSMSASGRFVSFVSEADDLVPGDTNATSDVFVHDRRTGTTERVSLTDDDQEFTSGAVYSSISRDGRYVTFAAASTGRPDSRGDIYVRDRKASTTELVTHGLDGAPPDDFSFGPRISAGGRYVTYGSYATNLVPDDTNGDGDIFLYDRRTRQTKRISLTSDGEQANFDSAGPSISRTGRYVAFTSWASNLNRADTNNQFGDIFVADTRTGQTTLVSIGSHHESGNSDSAYATISPDGRYVAFWSSASDLVEGDDNGLPDVFLTNVHHPEVQLVSAGEAGGANGAPYGPGDFAPAVDNAGRHVAFASEATNLVHDDLNGVPDIFVRATGAGPWPASSVGSVAAARAQVSRTTAPATR